MKRLVIGCVALLSLMAAAQSPAEFALRAPLATAQPEGPHAIELTEEVYRAALTGDLRDLRIFNAAGESLPLARLPQVPAASPPAQALRLVPLPAPARQDQALAEFKLRIDRAASHTTIELAPLPATPEGRAGIGGYLIDARPLQGQAGRLTLEFAADAADYAGRIELLGSDDLVHWRPLAGGALAFNRQLGAPVERNAFDIARLPDFVRVRWPDDAAPALQAARFTGRPAGPELPRAALQVRRDEAAQTYLVDVPIGLPITRLHVRAPRDNLSLRVRVSRYEEAAPREAHLRLRPRRAPERWSVVLPSVEVYRLSGDRTTVENEPVAWYGRTSALRLEVIDGVVPAADLLQVEAEWRPERIAFAARAPAPYLLAVGLEDAKAPPALALAPALLPPEDRAGLRLPIARLESRAAPAHAAAAAESPPVRTPQSPSWRALFWAVLLLAVGALALMALRLARQLRRPS